MAIRRVLGKDAKANKTNGVGIPRERQRPRTGLRGRYLIWSLGTWRWAQSGTWSSAISTRSICVESITRGADCSSNCRLPGLAIYGRHGFRAIFRPCRAHSKGQHPTTIPTMIGRRQWSTLDRNYRDRLQIIFTKKLCWRHLISNTTNCNISINRDKNIANTCTTIGAVHVLRGIRFDLPLRRARSHAGRRAPRMCAAEQRAGRPRSRGAVED